MTDTSKPSRFEVYVDNKPISFTLANESITFGTDVVLANRENDILDKASWYGDGFTVAPIFTASEFDTLQSAITQCVADILRDEGVKTPPNFSLDRYHDFVDSGYGLHQKVIERTRDLSFESLKFGFGPALERISQICKSKFTEINPILNKSFVIIRISRPSAEDYNPPHKDGYLDLWERTVNLWVPIAGCDRNSSLGIVPKSHLLSEKVIKRTADGAMMNGRQYRVPAIVEWDGSKKLERVDVKEGEVLIFSPLLIHGCAQNFNQDKTRVSLELRLSAVR